MNRADGKNLFKRQFGEFGHSRFEPAGIHLIRGDDDRLGRFPEAISLFRDISLSDAFVDFLTIPAYRLII